MSHILEELDISASLLDTLQLSIGLLLISFELKERSDIGLTAGKPHTHQCLDVAIHRVVNDCDLGSHV